MADRKTGSKTAVHDHASHPEAGSGMREDKTFKKPASDDEPEIAADDAGASAMAERAQKQSDDVEQR